MHRSVLLFVMFAAARNPSRDGPRVVALAAQRLAPGRRHHAYGEGGHARAWCVWHAHRARFPLSAATSHTLAFPVGTVIDFGKQHVITKDTVQVFIDALVYFRITDPRVAVLNIQVRRGAPTLAVVGLVPDPCACEHWSPVCRACVETGPRLSPLCL